MKLNGVVSPVLAVPWLGVAIFQSAAAFVSIEPVRCNETTSPPEEFTGAPRQAAELRLLAVMV